MLLLDNLFLLVIPAINARINVAQNFYLFLAGLFLFPDTLNKPLLPIGECLGGLLNEVDQLESLTTHALPSFSFCASLQINGSLLVSMHFLIHARFSVSVNGT
jgi:hypothetical protein